MHILLCSRAFFHVLQWRKANTDDTFFSQRIFINDFAISLILHYYMICMSVLYLVFQFIFLKDLCLEDNPNTLFFLLLWCLINTNVI